MTFKISKYSMRLILLAGILLFSSVQAADNAPDFKSVKSETCRIAKHFPGAKYDTKLNEKGEKIDEDILHENRLCSIDYHAKTGPTAVAVCPKLYATNPALIFAEIPEKFSKETVEQKLCTLNEVKVEKIAKFKPTSEFACSSTSAILGYYHLSRILGDLLHIQVSVAKTVDADYYEKKVDEAIVASQTSYEPVGASWKKIKKVMSPTATKAEKLDLFTKDGKHVYGALVKVMKKEKTYDEFGEPKAGNKWEAFKQSNPYYRLLTNKKPISEVVPNQFTSKNLQDLVAMRDASNMLLIDYLMSQHDRLGNISYKEAYYWKETTQDGHSRVRRSKLDKLTPKMIETLKPVKIKEMSLKDNDCGGIIFTNKVKDYGVLNDVYHLEPKTYRRLRWLRSIIDKSETSDFFKKELLFSTDDWKLFRNNVVELNDMFLKKCKSGDLKLDLNVKYFSGEMEKPSADECTAIRNYADPKSKEESDIN